MRFIRIIHCFHQMRGSIYDVFCICIHLCKNKYHCILSLYYFLGKITICRPPSRLIFPSELCLKVIYNITINLLLIVIHYVSQRNTIILYVTGLKTLSEIGMPFMRWVWRHSTCMFACLQYNLHNLCRVQLII